MRSLHEVAVALQKGGAQVTEEKEVVKFTVNGTPGFLSRGGGAYGRATFDYEAFVSRVCFTIPKHTYSSGKTNVGNPRQNQPGYGVSFGKNSGSFDPKSKSHLRKARKEKNKRR